MKNYVRVFAVLLLSALMCFAAAACGGDKTNYGTLTVENITLVEGEEKIIAYSFSDPEKSEEISYSFAGGDIKIENGKVTALKGGAVVNVTAKTAHHEAKFTVTTTKIDYGTLSVSNITLEEGEEAHIVPVFSDPDRAEAVSYDFDGSDIKIENGKVTALKGGAVVNVTAKTAHHEAKFTVTTTEIDYGTLSIEDITGLMTTANRAKIRVVFSKPERAEEISYSFAGGDIKIEDGYVTALVGGKTVTVTAKTAHHETTFTVTTLIDYGTLSVSDVYAWVGYPQSEMDIVFEYPEYAETLVYSYDETKISIDAEKKTVTALVAGDVQVTATSDNYSATFTVHAESVNKSSSNYDTSNYNSKVAGYKSEWENKGVADSTTLFIGDSFFDSGFWSNFYKDYAGKDVLRAGVSSTTSCDWEVFAESYLKYTDPKNIVIHMGTNNVYDDQMTVGQTVSALQRMFYVIHRQLPDAGIYYFNISQRSYDATKIGIVATVNDIMAAWCAGREWITLIDTSSLLTNDMLRDSVHPKNEYYYIFTDALAKTDIVISDAPIKEGVSFTAGTFDKTENKFTLDAAQRVRSYLVDGESEYSGNFAVSGTAAISGTGWTEFIINKTPADDWFKTDSSLPVSNITFTNGNSEIWGYKNGGKKASLAEVADGTFSFSVIAFNKSVLFKVNDSVVVYNDDGFTGTYFGFGAENAKLSITELSIVINDDTTVRAKYDAAAPVPSDTIDDIIRLESQRISDGSVTIAYKGALLNRNYILTGKLDIVSSGRNGHAEFKFSGDNNRILLWDNNTDGNWKVGYACGGAYNSNAPAKDIFVKESGKTLTLEWKLVVTDNDVYFYVNNALRLVWKGVPGSDITLSTENVGGKFYDMSALTLKDDKAEYDTAVAGMKSVIDSYAASGAGMYRA